MTRIRQDFPEVHECIGGPRVIQDPPGMFKCALPDECELCLRWVCNACEEVVPFGNGGDDDGAGLCDGCWSRFIATWEDVPALGKGRLGLGAG